MKKVRNKNRRKTSSSQGGFLFVGPIAVILLLVAVGCLSYLYLHHRCDLMGSRIVDLEERLESIKDEVAMEQSAWARVNTLQSVQAAVARHGLNMRRPEESRIIRMGQRSTHELAHLAPERSPWGDEVVHD